MQVVREFQAEVWTVLQVPRVAATVILALRVGHLPQGGGFQRDASAVAHVPEHACLFAQTMVAHRGELPVDDVDGMVVVPSCLRSHVPALLLPERLVVADRERGGPVTVDVLRTVGVDARLGIVAVSHGNGVVRLAEMIVHVDALFPKGSYSGVGETEIVNLRDMQSCISKGNG